MSYEPLTENEMTILNAIAFGDDVWLSNKEGARAYKQLLKAGIVQKRADRNYFTRYGLGIFMQNLHAYENSWLYEVNEVE